MPNRQTSLDILILFCSLCPPPLPGGWERRGRHGKEELPIQDEARLYVSRKVGVRVKIVFFYFILQEVRPLRRRRRRRSWGRRCHEEPEVGKVPLQVTYNHRIPSILNVGECYGGKIHPVCGEKGKDTYTVYVAAAPLRQKMGGTTPI